MSPTTPEERTPFMDEIEAESRPPLIRPPVETRVYRQLFDRETLADYLRLSTDTIDRLVKADKLACVRIGSQVRFTLEDVEAFLDRNRSERRAAR
jgi:excisionase family DNA binding protein